MRSETAYIGIGSNVGDRKANIKRALELIGMTRGVDLEKTSSIYETEPVGGPPQGDFLNGVIKVKTTLEPFAFLKTLQKIEQHIGKKKTVKNGPRAIDLDILLFGKKSVTTRNLKIPHPRMHKREFVLRGLRELGL